MKRKQVFLMAAISITVLGGCAAASQNELLEMINNGESIEIEVATPVNQEQGEEKPLDWVQLDQSETQPELRKQLDDIYKIAKFGTNSKNGVLYVNLEGKQEGNNTLYNVFSNSKFRSAYWENEDIKEAIATAAADNYADIEFEEGNYNKAVLAGINGYFNILKDAEVGYANMDSTITRLEAMGALFRADNPVTDSLSEDEEFNNAADPDNSNDETIYASNLSEQSYLDIGSKSLDELTAKGTITRGELVYMLVQNYFVDDYSNVDIKGDCYSDVKNGGDIATKQKFIDKDSQKDHWKSYELTYALQNPDKGCPESMYKALIVAKSKGIITGEESRWDEGVTKSDFLEMLTNSYLALTPQVSADQGEGDSISLEPTTDENGNLIYPAYPEEYIKFNPIDKVQLWFTDFAAAYENPNATKGELVKMRDYRVGDSSFFDATCEIDGAKYFRMELDSNNNYLIVSADCLSETAPEGTNSSASSDEEYVGGFSLEGVSPEMAEQIRNNYEEWSDEALKEAWDQVPEDLLDAAASMQFE